MAQVLLRFDCELNEATKEKDLHIHPGLSTNLSSVKKKEEKKQFHYLISKRLLRLIGQVPEHSTKLVASFQTGIISRKNKLLRAKYMFKYGISPTTQKEEWGTGSDFKC